MMTYLKHVGGKKHADLKNKNFEEIQVLYKKVKRFDKEFIDIGSAEDERQIKEMNEESKDPKRKRVVNETPREEDTTKVPAKQEVTEQGTKKRKSGHVKMIARKRPRPQPDNNSNDEHKKCLRIVTFKSTIDSEIMETKSFVSKLHKVDLVMKQYSKITPEGIELILWGDLKIMMESSIEENDQGDFWNNQQEWEIFRWRLSQLTLLHSEELASPGSNSSWLSIHIVVYNEELAIPEQTATSKGIPNPLIAGSLPKTIKPTKLDVAVLLRRHVADKNG
ncbi:hypothetical protein Tco_0086808 [Tanacetum coccineum]